MFKNSYLSNILVPVLLLLLLNCAGKTDVKQKVHKPDPELAKLVDFKKDLTGFRKTYGPNFYKGDRLFDYINGGADKYIALGFSEVMSFELQRGGNNEEKVIVDIYDMGNEKNSSMIFDKERSGKNVMLPGNLAASLSDNLLQYSKSKYYVKVTSFVEFKPEILVNIGTLISSKINK